MAIEHASASIHKGVLRAASVDWVSVLHEREWIVLPTTFHHFKLCDAQVVREKGWHFNIERNNVYATSEFKSNKDILCVHSDDVADSAQPIYDEVSRGNLQSKSAFFSLMGVSPPNQGATATEESTQESISWSVDDTTAADEHDACGSNELEDEVDALTASGETFPFTTMHGD